MKLDKKYQEIWEFFEITPAKASRAAKSSAYLVPGDLVLFTYSGSQRLCLVVATGRGSSVWTSSRGNTLLNCFELNSFSAETIEIFVSNLYKNRKIDYQTAMKYFKSLFGSKNFKTFNILKISDLFEIEL